MSEFETRTQVTVLDDLLAYADDRLADLRAGGQPVVATCLEDTHPTLGGRVLAEWRHDGHLFRHWLPVLQHLTVRKGDRLLVQFAANHPEPLVAGVVDGFNTRPEAPRREAASVGLKADETLTVADSQGQPLATLRQEAGGPVLALATGDMDLELAGGLRIRAAHLRLESAGDLELVADGDVTAKGDIITLN